LNSIALLHERGLDLAPRDLCQPLSRPDPPGSLPSSRHGIDIYALFDEIHQELVVGRGFELADISTSLYRAGVLTARKVQEVVAKIIQIISA